MSSFSINEVVIGDNQPSFVIAEIGHNHQGNLETAKKLIDAAIAAGANAVKFQKRSNPDLFTREFFNRPYESENSFASTYGMHREALEFGLSEYSELKTYSEERGIIFFATAFDHGSAEFLNELGVPAFKVASGDLQNIPLLDHLAQFGKPIFLSTGGGSIQDVDRAVQAVLSSGVPLCLMQCTAGYPPSWDELNLKVIQSFRHRYPDVVIGFSSHDNGIAMSVAAVALGASVIEKHFTLNRTMKGTDHAFSLEPLGLSKLVRDLKRLHSAMGDGVKRPFESENEPIFKMSKKLVAQRNLVKGHVLEKTDLVAKSPGGGMAPWKLDGLLGRTLLRDINEDEAVNEWDFSD